MELYIFCLVCVMILGIIIINGIYCFMYLSYPLPGGVDPCPPLSRFRKKARRRPHTRTRSPVRSPAQRQDSAAEVMIPMSQYEDQVDIRLQQSVVSSPRRSQLQQSTPHRKLSDRLDKGLHRVTSSRAGTSSSGIGTPLHSGRSITPVSHRSINISVVSITPPLARSNTPTRPPIAGTSSSRMKYGQTEI
ncbi:uncharacterized protein LOC111249498 [Varroa destructor]|uniref:Uncharacterized protein n=1 Tax=Varroa destructor TaxID=109461 RepID=A0A7M7K0Q9_VARDE|nr:uncharacterized protein LOC111249498 [Varroa destructor]XP_022659164.1 uncharacterized protein LOC111249498 [Varroa destructor]XP_022659165.1 uncharacterized protein LOC111249498 [Varroa destructor]